MARIYFLGNPIGIFSDYLSRRLHDFLMTSEIHIQKNPFRLRVICQKPLYAVGRGPAEAINGLIVVPHDKQIIPRPG